MSKCAIGLLIAGLALTFGAPSAGLLVTVIGVMTSFGRIGPDHAVSLNQLAGPLSVSLMATWVGFAGGVVGVGLLIATGFVLYSERQKPGD